MTGAHLRRTLAAADEVYRCVQRVREVLNRVGVKDQRAAQRIVDEFVTVSGGRGDAVEHVRRCFAAFPSLFTHEAGRNLRELEDARAKGKGR